MKTKIKELIGLVTKLNSTALVDNETTKVSTEIWGQINALTSTLAGDIKPAKINTGTPAENGIYVAYIDSSVCNGFPHPDKTFLVWNEGHWYQRGCSDEYKAPVHGWIGPMPTERIADLQKQQ